MTQPLCRTLKGEVRHDYEAPRLFQNILSLDHPDCLAFIGFSLAFQPAFPVSDLASMALAQMWSKPELLPTEKEMQDQYREHLKWRASVRTLPNPFGKPPPPLMLETAQFLTWAQRTAGIYLDEHLSYTAAAAWYLWWTDRELSRLLMDGFYAPHARRLFDSKGRRKAWPGARDAIKRVNEQLNERKAKASLSTPIPGDLVPSA